MGYTTKFAGRFTLDKPLAPEHAAYLKAFNATRRMKRDAFKAAEMPDPLRDAAGLPLGPDAAYFVGGGGSYGQDRDASVVDYNHEPEGQPGLWCQWTPSEDGAAIEWDQGEKFYYYGEWLAYIVEHFLKPWGYDLSGSVTWQGEEVGDVGTLSVKDGRVHSKKRHGSPR